MQYFTITHDTKYLSKVGVNLLVGNRSINSKVIACRHLQYNLEHHPKLCSFTGWYAISENKLGCSDKLCLMEYDVILSDNFYSYHEEVVSNYISDNSIVSYSYAPLNHYVFTKSTPWLEIILEQFCNLNMSDFVQKYGDKYDVWPTSTNVCLSKGLLDNFVDWFAPMTDLFSDDELGSYVHERAFFVFCAINNIKVHFLTKPVLKHSQKASHNSLDIYGRVLKTYETNELSEDMISYYDSIYEKALKKIKDELDSGR
jgi:hypothetical protein